MLNIINLFSFQVPFSSNTGPGQNHHRQNQHFGDQDLHLGVEAVLRRFSQRSHHHRSADTTYSNLNEIRRSQQHFSKLFFNLFLLKSFFLLK